MAVDAEHARLRQISVDSIERNEHNPRILFRQRELDELVDSIRTYGIQVPLSVYRKGNRYILIDGERRWRCAIKLNMKTVPALVQDEPDVLTNILLMFNIHALREQWDLLTIALKLHQMIELLEAQMRKRPTERELARATGLPRSTIRRSRLLLELPKKYQNMMLKELEKPKPQQRLTEDFFIEMERALKTVERAMPGVIDDKNHVRDALIRKFKSGIIDNRVHFRNVARIARAENVQADTDRAEQALIRLFEDDKTSIAEAYESSVAEAYAERDIITRLSSLVERLNEISISEVDEDLRGWLVEVVEQAERLLDGMPR